MWGDHTTSTDDASYRLRQWERSSSTERRRHARRFVAIAVFTGFLLLGAVATPALAATDTLFAAPAAAGTGDCSSAANACAITTAVTTANGEPVADSVRIELASGSYQLSSPSPTALTVTFAGPSLTFEAESGTPILDGMNTVRLMSVGSTSNVTIDGLEITSGATTGVGGGINNSGTLTVKNSTVSGSSAANGGAIADAAGATLTAQNVTVAGAPTVQITSPASGTRVAFGARLIARYSCQDGPDAPGIQSCSGPVASGSPLDTSRAETHSFTVTATSTDGQSTSHTTAYTVMPSNVFSIVRTVTRSDGVVTVKAKFPGPGKVDVLETAWLTNEASAAALRPAAGRFVF